MASKKDRFARTYHSVERVEFIAARLCCVPGCSTRVCVNAHTKGGGTGRKADYDTIVPMCHHHHDKLHNIGRASFALATGCTEEYLKGVAVGTEMAWQEYLKATQPQPTYYT